MLRNWSAKLGAKFPSTTLGYSVLIISRLGDSFSGILELEASPIEGQQLQQKDKKSSKRKGEKN